MMVYNLNSTHFFTRYCNWKRIGWKDDACLPITIDVTASHVEKKLTHRHNKNKYQRMIG